MAGVTDVGFLTKTFDEVRDPISTSAQTAEYFGATFPTSPDSVFWQINSVFSAAIKESGWDLGQSIYDQFNRDKASGKNLDDIAEYVNLQRIEASGSTGSLLFSGSNARTVPLNTGVKDLEGFVVTTDDVLVYDRTSCYKVLVDAIIIVPNDTYTMVINTDTYDIIATSSPTKSSILAQFQSAITTQPTYESSVNSDGMLEIVFLSRNNNLSVSVGSKLLVTQVSSFVTATATQDGDRAFPAGVLTNLETTPVGTVSVTNLLDFDLGRDEETDEELRTRMSSQKSNAGVATKPAIESSISNITGVTSSLVIENDSIEVDVEGRPPKSFELFVSGGDEDVIAQTLYDTKPATIKTYGSVEKFVTDLNGESHAIYFSRPDQKYAWVVVTYTLYDEELFPVGGDSLIEAAVATYGNSLDVGVDIIPQRFATAIYDAVDGLDTISVEIGLSLDNVTPPASYSTSRITVEDSERVAFDASRNTASV